MKRIAMFFVLSVSAVALAADAPKPEVKFTPELQNKLQAALIQQLQAQIKIENLDKQYKQLSDQFQAELRQSNEKAQKLQDETLKQLQLDPKTHQIRLDEQGNLSVVDTTTEKK